MPRAHRVERPSGRRARARLRTTLAPPPRPRPRGAPGRARSSSSRPRRGPRGPATGAAPRGGSRRRQQGRSLPAAPDPGRAPAMACSIGVSNASAIDSSSSTLASAPSRSAGGHRDLHGDGEQPRPSETVRRRLGHAAGDDAGGGRRRDPAPTGAARCRHRSDRTAPRPGRRPPRPARGRRAGVGCHRPRRTRPPRSAGGCPAALRRPGSPPARPRPRHLPGRARPLDGSDRCPGRWRTGAAAPIAPSPRSTRRLGADHRGPRRRRSGCSTPCRSSTGSGGPRRRAAWPRRGAPRPSSSRPASMSTRPTV